jgi:hypothetical protein
VDADNLSMMEWKVGNPIVDPEPELDQAIAALSPEQRKLLELRARRRLQEDMGDISREGDALWRSVFPDYFRLAVSEWLAEGATS